MVAVDFLFFLLFFLFRFFYVYLEKSSEDKGKFLLTYFLLKYTWDVVESSNVYWLIRENFLITSQM